MFLYINIMALKILIVTISILAFLVFIKYIEKTKEDFISNLKQRKEHFNNISIQNVHANNSDDEEDREESETSNSEVTNNNVKEELVEEPNNNSNQQCDSGKPEGDCLFGCDDKGVSKYTNDNKEATPANLEKMMKTFEETEKICEAIERKDKERRDREALENLEKQLQLNKKFLVQQKAQNKQIEDLQKLIQAMQFDEDMKKVAVQKCSGKADDCLSDKEKEMSKILQMRAARKQNMKVNLNIDPFGEEFKKKLMQSLKLPEGEMAKLLNALKKGDISMNDLINGGQGVAGGQGGAGGQGVAGGQGGAGGQGVDGNGLSNKKGYDNSCPNCNVNLEDYIDKCKIPCKNCRDPAWKCPQDVGGK